ncbi:D-alanyl-D-alanine carboxypeptidase family protein [Butyricicoccus porcorum]|nr:D-alanyl-D-alanine carboxypeptidase family protein [Butyricicoccus porcorum]MCI6926025.1 D-alanyl-D-alanine carboxypeptidase [Butyricicoccus porcorum]MDD6987386.1 D-alanyl-D-alanine carboxypeptidase [Butyricicoccus porcorum]MDY4484437.1 D-alanyl-D-alanine carboxypeptidase family protein [Butyricicoccus porcorum]
MRKRLLFCICLAVLLCARHALAYSASAYAVLSADTGVLLDGSQENQRLPMASTTKIMTGLLAAEDPDLEREITVPAACAGVEGSSMYLKAGEKLPLREILYGLMLCSGNDAAECIAAVCGGREDFIARMNTRAEQLGLANTHFDNPSGLDGETHYTTAYELAKLAAFALKNETFAEVVATTSHTYGTRTMVNHNKMLRLYDGAIGVKTGFTRTAGRCLVSAAERDGRTVVVVTLNDGNDWNDHISMLDAAFAGMKETSWAQKGEAACEISVQTGQAETVSAVYADDLSATMLAGEQAELRIFCAPFLYAPVEKGMVCGFAQVVCGDTVLCETELLCANAVAADETQADTGWWERFLLWLDRIRGREIEEMQ